MPTILSELDEATDPIRHVLRDLDARFGSRISSLGCYVCKLIEGTNTPSQHAWGNAIDVGGSTSTLDQVARRARSAALRPYVSQVLWQVPDHYGHVHISGRPYREGTPPCMTPGGGGEGPGGTSPGGERTGRSAPVPKPGKLVKGENLSASFYAARRRWGHLATRAARAGVAIRRTMR